jgi:hypothetical protein
MSNAEQPFYRRPLWIVVAIFIAVVLVGGGIAAVTGAFNGNATTADSTASAAPTKSALPTGAASVCGLKGYETSNDLSAAPEAKWVLIGSTASPKSAAVGPGKSDDDGVFNTCFAHTPTGALFASINYVATTTDARNADRLWELLADSSVKNQLRATPQPATDDTTRGQVSGFKVDHYDGSSATIDLAVTLTGTGSADGLISYPVVLKWQDGDWKVVFTEDGPPIAPSALSSLGGYIPFSGA